jgi:hypothetical protein
MALAPAWLKQGRTLVGILAFAAVTAIAAASGGYFPTTWNWATLAFAWVAALALAFRGREAWGRREPLLLVALLALAGWTALSTLWSLDATQSVLEAQRALVYLAAALALVALVRRGEHPAVLGGVLAGIVAISTYALATRLFPDRLGYYDPAAGYRLSTPLGYWNALGIFAVIGILLALGFLAESERLPLNALAGGSLVVLSLVLYFTYSRGSYGALALGLAAMLALSPRRGMLAAKLLAVGPAVAVSVMVASRSHTLTRRVVNVAAAAHDGHRVALAVLLLVVLAGGMAVASELLFRHVSLPRRERRAALALASLLVAVAVTVALVHAGGPVTVARRAYHSFTGPPVVVRPGDNLSKRLFSLSSSGRLELWRVARDEFEAAPVAGKGAGSFTLYWPEHRPVSMHVLDAHDLYVQTAAELGLVGLVLLLVAFAVPLSAARELRRLPLGAPALSVWIAFLFHAGVDWDWQMPAVTLTALIVAAAPLSALRPPPSESNSRLRLGGLGLALLLALLALAFLPGNLELAKAQNANQRGHHAAAANYARRAARLAPWSSQPPFQRALAFAALGHNAEAAASARKALSHSPNEWQLWALLARVTQGSEQQHALARLRTLNPLAPSPRTLSLQDLG